MFQAIKRGYQAVCNTVKAITTEASNLAMGAGVGLLTMLGFRSGDASAAPVDISLLEGAVDLSTINTTIGAVFTSIITVLAFIWAGYKIIKLFRGA